MTPRTNDPLRVRTTAIGLLSFAAAEEQLVLATAARTNGNQEGSPDRWAAVPLVAHNTDFRNQQVQRLDAVRTGTVPPAFAEIDHTSAEVYRGYCQPPPAVAETSRRSTQDLIAGLSAISDEDLLDPARNPWLGGRQLWLQIVVRGFWHPTGHLGDYYIAHGQPGRAVALHNQAVIWARYLNAPDAAQGMASYNLACAQAKAGHPDDAYAALSEAIALNSDLLANAARDADLSSLRDHGKLDALLGYG